MRVTTEIDTAGQVKQPLPHAPHDIQVTPGSKLRIDIIWNNEDDVEDVNQALFESITPCETHLGAFFTSMVPKSSEMVSRVGNIYMYFWKGSLEGWGEYDKKLDGYALIVAARGFGRLGHTFPPNVCLDEVLSFLYDLICAHRGNAMNDAARYSSSRLKSYATNRPQHKLRGVAIQLIIRWCRASGCRALENDMKTENPTRLPFNIYIMCNEKRAVPGLYVQPKTPLSLKGKYEIGETHDLERSGTETPVKQKEDHTADDLSLHKCEHVRAATCRNLTSIALENVKDLPGYSIAQHTTTLRVCYLLFRAKEYKAINDKTLPEPCIKCISEAFTRKQLEDGLKWAISEIESLLSLPLSPQFEIHDRMTCYQKELNIQPFPFEKTKETMFKSRGQVIAALQFKRRFELEKQDYGVVRDDSRAQVIYAVACLLVSNHSPPKNLQQDDLDKIFDQFIRWLDHKNTS